MGRVSLERMNKFSMRDLEFQALFLIFIYVCVCGCESCLPQEKYALLQFKNSIMDANGILPSWDTSTDCCSEWEEVICNDHSSHVQGLLLNESYISTSIADFLFPLSELHSLTYLDLSNNDLNISAVLIELAKFPNITHLRLNNITSEDRKIWNLEFQGWGIESLGKLEYLDLGANWLLGRVPPQLANMTSLLELHLENSFISGFESLSHLRDLKVLDMSGLTVDNLSKSNLHCLGEAISTLQNLTHIGLSNIWYDYETSKEDEVSGPNMTVLSDLLDLTRWSAESLHRLEYLDLSGNNLIYGKVPSQLWNMSSLAHLDLGETSLTMDEDHERISGLSNLKFLGLRGLNLSMFSGHFWEYSIANLTHLHYLDVSESCIAHDMEHMKGIGKLGHLKELYMSGNNIRGGFPQFIGSMPLLTELDLSSNMLDGQINWSIPEKMERLDLSGNSLRGSITEEFFGNATELLGLYMYGNKLNLNFGPAWIPPFSLRYLDFSGCNINATLPSWISTQVYLEILILSDCNLYGALPSWFSDFSQTISVLQLSYNQFQSSFHYAGRALEVDISYNQFDALLLNSTPTVSLFARNNNLKGPLPSFKGVANSDSLSALDLSNNRLSGRIPSSIGNLSSLLFLSLSNNFLNGPLPSSMINCTSLLSLQLGNNLFNQSFPTWILQMKSLEVLQMNSDHLYGFIPKNINNLSSLQFLDLSNNRFIGGIPKSLYKLPSYQNPLFPSFPFDNFGFNSKGQLQKDDSLAFNSKGQYLQYPSLPSELLCIDLSSNFLSGYIFEEIGTLRLLKQLNLSHNSLVGKIPRSIKNLKELESLDLSFNLLTEEIPVELQSMASLEVLNLSYNNLSGRIPRGGQMLTYPESSFLGNPNLKDPLSSLHSKPPQPSETAINDDETKEHDSQFWWEITVALCYGVGFGGFYIAISISKRLKNKVCKVQNLIIFWIAKWTG